MSILTILQKDLRRKIAEMPDDFYDTFNFTRTGNNLTHPITVGAIAGSLGSFDGVAHVGIDVRLGKFSPDVVGFDSDFEPVVLVDYESPNSSDARVPVKDVRRYLEWCARRGSRIPYVIITTLPDYDCPRWKVRWVQENGYNREYKESFDEIRQNPFDFWYRKVYTQELRNTDLSRITFMNMSGRKLSRVRVPL